MVDRKPILTKKTIVIDDAPLFGKQNKILMGVGAIIIILGMIVMAGGKSPDPKMFDYNQVYSKVRITVAPFFIIIGILIEVVAIFRKPATTTE